jgi:hypothetical protein
MAMLLKNEAIYNMNDYVRILNFLCNANDNVFKERNNNI